MRWSKRSVNAGGKQADGPATQPVAERPRTASDLRKEEKAEAAAARQASKDNSRTYALDKTPQKLQQPHPTSQVRFRTGFIYVTVSVLCILVISDWTTLVLLAATAGICAGEFYYMLRSDAKLPNEMLGIVGGRAVPRGGVLLRRGGSRRTCALRTLLALLVWYVFWHASARARRGRELLRRRVHAGCCSRASSSSAARCLQPWGGVLVLLLFVSVWANDSFAYLVGRKFGKHKLAPRTSPEEELGRVLRRIGGARCCSGWPLTFVPGVTHVHSAGYRVRAGHAA